MRYDGLNNKNYYDRLKLLDEFYSEEIKGSTSWAVNEGNHLKAYEIIHNDGINSKTLYQNVNYIENNKYNAVVIVMYNLEIQEESYCTEYNYELTMEDDLIDSIVLLLTETVFTPEDEVVIENGKLIQPVDHDTDDDHTKHWHFDDG